jgi:hypothetical protein
MLPVYHLLSIMEPVQLSLSPQKPAIGKYVCIVDSSQTLYLESPMFDYSPSWRDSTLQQAMILSVHVLTLWSMKFI